MAKRGQKKRGDSAGRKTEQSASTSEVDHLAGTVPPAKRGGSISVVRFILIFAGISAIGVAFEYYLMEHGGAIGYRSLVARTADHLPGWFGISTEVRGSQIWVGQRLLEVTPECSGVEPIAIFVAGVLAIPCSRRKKLLGLFLGFFGVGFLNLVRVGWLAVVASWWSGGFDAWHNALMHMFPLFVVLPLWLVWLSERGGVVLWFLGCLAATSVLWGVTSDRMIDATLAITKELQSIVGAPTPFLLMDELRYWWVAPPLQLFASLVMVSSWISWHRRLIALTMGSCLLWFVVVMDVIAQSSPYVGPYEGRYLLSSILTKGHLIVSPVLMWLVLIPLPAFNSWARLPTRSQRNAIGTPKVAKDETNAKAPINSSLTGLPRMWPRLLIALMCAAWLPLALRSLSRGVPAEVIEARHEMAKGVFAWQAGEPVRTAAQAALRLGSIQEKTTQRKDQHVYYMAGRLLLEDALADHDPRGHAIKLAVAKKMLLDDSMSPKAKRKLEGMLSKIR